MGSGIAPPSQSGSTGQFGESDSQTSLDDFADDHSVTSRQGRIIDERRERLEEILGEKFDITESFQYGTHTRGTKLGPLDEESDIDVMIVLDEDAHREWAQSKNGAINCLRALKRHLERKYPNSKVSIDRNVVAVQFHDFKVEVAPAYQTANGGYSIPDTYSEGRSWIRTNPRGYKQRFEAVDNARNGNLRKIARLARIFQQNRNVPITPYHAEVMAYNFVRRYPDKEASTEELAENFFEQLPRRIKRGTRDPVSDDRLDEHLDRKARRQAIRDARKAREGMREAKQHREAGEVEKADEKYGEALGEDEG